MPTRSALATHGAAGHICSLYQSRQEWWGLLSAFLEVGILRREKCLCLVSDGSEKLVRKALQAAGPRIEGAVVTRAVDLTTIERAYSKRRGSFTQRALDYWRSARDQALTQGFSGLRGIIQADRLLGGPGVLASWIAYEYQLTELVAHSGGAMLCLYNRAAQPAAFVRDVLQAHTLVAHQGVVGENSFYAPLEEYSAPDQASRAADRMLSSLARQWRREAASPRALNASRRLSEVLRSMKGCALVIRSLATELREHKREQEQLRRQMDYFALGQKITRTGSWAWNVSSGELFWSREHFRIFGLPAGDTKISYRLFFRMVHAEERVAVDREFQAAARAGRDFDCEYRIVRQDGSVRQIHSRAYPVFGQSGDLTEYVGTVADITERRRGEDSLGSMQAELARASRAITIRQLMATIAHEVNQPLAALVANAGAARRWLAGNPPRIDKIRQSLARIVRDGNRASDVIARIRALLGSSDTERNPLNLNSIVQEVIALLRSELRRHSITVRTDLDENLPLVQCDRVQMQQVLLNLIVNAIDSMSTVETRSRLLLITTVAGVTGVLVCVADRGVGLDEQDSERIFEPFYTTKPHGMGIGLAISRTIIEAHGGRLWATPNKASGTTFRFQLPFNGANTG